jgi:phosphoserine aminotransferase
MSARKIFFTSGPSALYFTVEEHIRTALREQIPSISHRSKAFTLIYQNTEEQLRELVGLPDDYRLFFTSSATEVWERMLQSAVSTNTLHLVNGAFSRRFYQIAQKLGYRAAMIEAPAGSAVSVEDLRTDQTPELIGVTHNETSTGVQQPLEDLEVIREQYPESLLTVDAVSSFPVVNLPFEKIDALYFSVQKCFGLPAGLGGWLVNQRFVDRALQLAPTGKTSYHGIDTYLEHHRKHQTPSTPNVLGIYLLGRVVQDMLEKGLERIRMESKYKSAILYHMLDSKQSISPFVKENHWRSETVVVAETKDQTNDIIERLDQKGLVIGSGYGPYKEKHIRIANFPTHSKEQIEMLVDLLDQLAE